MFLSWVRFHGRSADLADRLGVPGYFVPGRGRVAPVRYLTAWVATWRILARTRPRTVIVMQPPVVALWAVLPWSWLTGGRIVGDLHSGAFDDPKWDWATSSVLRILRGRGLAVVTNDALAEIVRGRGGRVAVLHDMVDTGEPDRTTGYDSAALRDGIAGRFVLVPLAWAHDEPVAAVLAAAARAPDALWVLTGRAPDRVLQQAPANVLFSGYVSNEDFRRLLSRAAAVLALTTRENTMQRAGYEAMSYGKALVTSGTAVLREYFGDAAVVVEPTTDGIAAGVRAALDDTQRLERRITELRAARQAEQESALAKLAGWLGAPAQTTLAGRDR